MQPPKHQTRGPAKHQDPTTAAQHIEKVANPQDGPLGTTTSSQRDIYLKSLGLGSCETSSFIRRQGLRMGIPGPLLPHRVEQGLVSSLLPRPPRPQEERCHVRIEKVQKNTSKTTTFTQKGVPASIGMDGLAKAPPTQLTGPFSGLLKLEVHLLGTGHSASRLKLPEGGLPRPH